MLPKMMIAMPPRALLLLTLLLGLAACGPGYLDAGQKVPATPQNKEIFEVLKAYHQAIEDRDIDALKALISLQFAENGGTTDDPTDDYGYDKLLLKMTMLRDNVKKLHLQLQLREIEVKGDDATAEVHFVGTAVLTEGGVDNYRTWDDINRVKFKREDGAWHIIGGL